MAERGGAKGNFISPYQISVAAGSMSMTGQGSGWFGPGAPPAQNVPDAVRGRAFDFAPGYNLAARTKPYEPISFQSLRAIADGYDLLRLVIETRKDQIGRRRWTIQNKEGVKTNNDAVIKAATTFFKKPDGVTGWKPWLRSLLEDLFVIDAPTLFMQRDRAGRLLALEQIDGATIKPVIDDRGRIPRAFVQGGSVSYPVAYQQILKGQMLDYSVRDLIYAPRNKRPHRVYGYAPVEQVVTTVNIALRRQATTLEYFTEGTVPDAFVGVPENWSPAQIREFQANWDAYFTGDTAVRRRAKFVPGAMKIQQTRDPELKDAFDEWLARVICYAFSVSPQALMTMMNRATAEVSHASAEEEGLSPILDWVKDLIDGVLEEEFGLEDVEFIWQEDKTVDEKSAADIRKSDVGAAIMTINQARIAAGLEPYGGDHPAADIPMVLTATGYVPIDANTIDGKKAMQEAFPTPPEQIGHNGGPPLDDDAGQQQPAQKLAKADDPSPQPIDADEQEKAILAALEPALADVGDDLAAQIRAGLKKKT